MSAAPRALLFVLAFLASIALAPTACADMAGPSASLPGSLDAKKPLHAPKAAVTEAIFANCFLAGTLVETDQGMKPIEQIEVGDQVLAHPEGGFHKGERAFKPVVRLSRNTTPQVCRLTIGPARPQGRTEAHVVGEAKEGGEDSEEPPSGSQQILCTPNHPIFLVGRGWVFTGKLKPGDLLVGASGALLEVRAVEVWDEVAPIFNFEVEDWHTYFVAGDQNAESVWVHNRRVPKRIAKKRAKAYLGETRYAELRGLHRQDPEFFPNPERTSFRVVSGAEEGAARRAFQRSGRRGHHVHPIAHGGPALPPPAGLAHTGELMMPRAPFAGIHLPWVNNPNAQRVWFHRPQPDGIIHPDRNGRHSAATSFWHQVEMAQQQQGLR